MTNLYAVELAELDKHEAEMEKACGLIRSNVVVFGKHLAAIHESQCWKGRHKSFDLYCEERWLFTGSRGRQLIAAYDVAKNLGDMTGEDTIPTLFFQYFNESHARVLKELPPEQQRTAWNAATANGEAPTAKILAEVVDEIKAEDIYAMGKEEQHEFVKGLEEKAEAASIEQEAIEIVTLALKRLRAVADSIRDERFGSRFIRVALKITGLQDDLEKLHEEWTAPLLETAK